MVAQGLVGWLGEEHQHCWAGGQSTAWCRSKWERLLPSFLPLPKSGVAMPALPAAESQVEIIQILDF